MSKVLTQHECMKNQTLTLQSDGTAGLLATGRDGGMETSRAATCESRVPRRARAAVDAPTGTRNVRRGAFGRMKRIFGWLQDGMYPNCSKIARELEVSVKTAERDIDYMRDEWALPIVFDRKWNGYHFYQTVDRLP